MTIKQWAKLFGVRSGYMAYMMQLAGYRFDFGAGGVRPVEVT